MKAIIYIILLGAIVSGCGKNSHQYKIRGSFTDQVEEEWVYLARFMDSEPQMDSARIENNEFSFEGVAEIVEVYGLSFHPSTSPEIAPFFLEPGELEVVVDPNDWFMGTRISGGEINDEYSVLDLMGFSQDSAIDYIQNNPSSPVSLFLISLVYRSLELQKTGELLALFPEKVHQSAVYQEVSTHHHTQLSLADRIPSFRYTTHAEETEVDFDTDRIIGTLAELNNNRPVYLKIWGTWCAPCRAEFPSIRKVEEKFRGGDLEFAYICIESREEDWREMVTSEKLRGQHYLFSSELTGRLAAEINLRTVPRYLLIDGSGEIIDYNAPKPSDEGLSSLLGELGE